MKYFNRYLSGNVLRKHQRHTPILPNFFLLSHVLSHRNDENTIGKRVKAIFPLVLGAVEDGHNLSVREMRATCGNARMIIISLP